MSTAVVAGILDGSTGFPRTSLRKRVNRQEDGAKVDGDAVRHG